jgi:hypothetical protein
MIANALELHNPTERDKFDFLSFSSARPLDLARYFKETIANATNREGKRLLARVRKVYGSKLIKDLLALLDWLGGMSEQYQYNLQQFFAFNPYHADRFLFSLPALGDRFTEFVEALDDARGEDGLVTPKQIRDALQPFLPARAPRPKFDPGNELTGEHLAYFKKKLLGRSRKAEVLAEKEALFNTYLSVAEGIASGQPLKVEHLATAIARCGDDPAVLLPRPSKTFTVWEIGEFGRDNNPAAFQRSETDEPAISVGAASPNGSDGNAFVPAPEELEESEDDGFSIFPDLFETVEPEDSYTAPVASATDIVESPNRDIPLQPAGDTPVETISESPVAEVPSPETVSVPPLPTAVPVTRAAGVTPSQPELCLRPGVRVRTTGSGEVGRLLKITETGWLVKFKGGLNRILPAERLVAIPDTDPPASTRAENNTKPKNSKKKGFGLSVA